MLLKVSKGVLGKYKYCSELQVKSGQTLWGGSINMNRVVKHE